MAKWHQSRRLSAAETATLAGHQLKSNQKWFNIISFLMHLVCIGALAWVIGGVNG